MISKIILKPPVELHFDAFSLQPITIKGILRRVSESIFKINSNLLETNEKFIFI